MRDHYQMANRLATLHFLNSRGLPTHLVLICFLGDRWPYARRAFKIASSLPSGNEEPRKYYRKKEAAIRYAKKTIGLGVLRSALNRAAAVFEHGLE